MADEVTVLVVEDNPQLLDYLTAKIGSLELATGRPTRVLEAIDLATARKVLDVEAVSLVVLDLNLPDSEGLETVVRVADAAPALPLVVVTGSATPEIIERLMLAGAHDCLVKGSFGGSELSRTLRVNLARHRRFLDVVGDLLTGQALEDTEEVRVPSASASAAASASLGRLRLSETFPAQVEEARTRYAELVGRRLEERALHVDHQVSTHSRALAWDLGRYRASPRDVVDVHQRSLVELVADKPPARRAALTRAAESLLVETMGHLAACYRTQSLGSSLGPASTDQGDRNAG